MRRTVKGTGSTGVGSGSGVDCGITGPHAASRRTEQSRSAFISSKWFSRELARQSWAQARQVGRPANADAAAVKATALPSNGAVVAALLRVSACSSCFMCGLRSSSQRMAIC